MQPQRGARIRRACQWPARHDCAGWRGRARRCARPTRRSWSRTAGPPMICITGHFGALPDCLVQHGLDRTGCGCHTLTSGSGRSAAVRPLLHLEPQADSVSAETAHADRRRAACSPRKHHHCLRRLQSTATTQTFGLVPISLTSARRLLLIVLAWSGVASVEGQLHLGQFASSSDRQDEVGATRSVCCCWAPSRPVPLEWAQNRSLSISQTRRSLSRSLQSALQRGRSATKTLSDRPARKTRPTPIASMTS